MNGYILNDLFFNFLYNRYISGREQTTIFKSTEITRENRSTWTPQLIIYTLICGLRNINDRIQTENVLFFSS